jgi:hypothetical protein
MEAEELLERYEKEIFEWWSKNKLKFCRYGCDYENYKTIRDKFNFKPPKRDEKEAFVGICDNRIDNLKTTLRDDLAKSGALITLFTVAIALAIFDADSQHSWALYLFSIIFFIVLVLGLSEILCVRVQIRAWHAIKEGVLLMKERNKRDIK